MKQKILDALKTKFAGVKEEILDRIATKAAKTITTEDEVKTYVEGVTFQQVLDAYGDNRATEATKTAVSNYEKKHKLKDGKPVEPEPDPNKPDPDEGKDMPAWAKALVESNKAMQAQMAAMNAEKLTGTRKSKLDELLKDAPESIQQMYNTNFAAMKFDDDAAFDKWIEDTKPQIEAVVNTFKANGAVVHSPFSRIQQKQKGEVNATLKAQVDAASAAAKAAPAQGAPILGMPAAN